MNPWYDSDGFAREAAKVESAARPDQRPWWLEEGAIPEPGERRRAIGECLRHDLFDPYGLGPLSDQPPQNDPQKGGA